MPLFAIPDVLDNPEGWGPTTEPEHLKGIPYAPFSKGDKVGRISDFAQTGFKYGGRYPQNQQPGTAVFNFFHNEEDDQFHLVDNRPTRQNRGVRRFQPNRFQQRRDAERRQEQALERGQHQVRSKQQQKRQQFSNFHRSDQRQVLYSASVDVRPEWGMVEQIAFSSFSKLIFQVSDPTDMAFCGQLQHYDKLFDRVTPKATRPLQRTRRVFRSVTTSDDPVIRRLAGEDAATVFITDSLLATLMCSPRSVYSWDIVVTRAGDKLFFDKREGSNLDLLSVAETAPDPPQEDKDAINGVQQLCVEATAINQNFSQQVLVNGERKDCPEANPFKGEENEELASVAYKYRKFQIKEGVELVVRCEIDGVMSYKGEEQLLSIKALNEFDSKTTGVDWRQKLETQRGAVLATELKNNANKLAKWTAAALVAGADMIKLGYVSRTHPRDNHNHVILGTQICKPRDFAMQINLNMDNCWGIVRALVDLTLKLGEGKYLLVKEPNKPLLHLYSLPDGAFEQNYVDEPLPEVDEAAPAAAKAEDGADDDEE
ncbi:hypothetical protein WJX73_010444 [Symbiochloris irregularis]|uniref:Eukaryotic translation initiation factor 3 subunit D n=1 Tax=Symbiochloris irregularis TaxID=706552 RepID=A0AAW1PMG0_9CHLO